jgi:hypothetical protein
MAQALIDNIVWETVGQVADMDRCLMDQFSLEVLGFFQWGNIEVDQMTMEVLGNFPNTTYIDHAVFECVGQWAGF